MIRVGDEIVGYWSGGFDGLRPYRVEVVGADYVVVRGGGGPDFIKGDPEYLWTHCRRNKESSIVKEWEADNTDD